MDLKCNTSQGSERNRIHIFGNYYTVVKSTAELHSAVVRKADFISEELGCLPEVISKQSVKGTASFLLAVHSKRQEERDN